MDLRLDEYSSNFYSVGLLIEKQKPMNLLLHYSNVPTHTNLEGSGGIFPQKKFAITTSRMVKTEPNFALLPKGSLSRNLIS